MSANTLTWEDAPGRRGAILGLGCAGLLVAFGCAGAVAAVEQQAWGSLIGVPFVLLFAGAAVMLGLTRSRVEVDAAAREVRRHSLILGLSVRRLCLPLGQAEAVSVRPLALGGRTLHRVVVVGEHNVDVIASEDRSEAAQRAAALADLLGVELR